MKRLDVHLGEGIGPLKFGMRPAEVRLAFPEAECYESWMGGNLNDSLLYHGLVLHFSECNGVGPLPHALFNYLVIQGREDAFLFDIPLTSWSKWGLIEVLKAMGLSPALAENGDVEVPFFWICASFGLNGSLIRFDMDKNVSNL